MLGSAATLAPDLVKAERLAHKLPRMAIRLAGLWARCDYLFSIDRDALSAVTASRDFASKAAEVHSIMPPGGKKPTDFPWIQYFWSRGAGGGTSAWVGAAVALSMGYDEVWLCGAPLEPMKYADGSPAPTFANHLNVNNMRIAIERDKHLHALVRSFSGWTRDLLGEPKL